MIPGVGKAIKDIDIDDNAFAGVEAIINSMTKAERETPEIVEDMRKMMKAATAMKNPMKMMKQMRQMRQMGRR